MAAAVQARLQPPHSRAQAAPWQSARHALSSASCRGSWGGGGWAPSLPPPLLLVAAAARAAVLCHAAGPAPSQAAEPQPDKEPKKPFSWVVSARCANLLRPPCLPCVHRAGASGRPNFCSCHGRTLLLLACTPQYATMHLQVLAAACHHPPTRACCKRWRWRCCRPSCSQPTFCW